LKRAVYPGSFDPVTFGHIDILKRALRTFDEVTIAVLKNTSKNPMFTFEERVAMIEEATRGIEGVKVDSFDGLLVDYLQTHDIDVIVKGLRAISDFEAEFQMAAVNRKLNGQKETVFIMTRTEYMYLSSSIVKEVARLGGDVSEFVPACVIDQLNRKVRGK
jgi:pantetheine-phosphate adenylyltransferase